VKGIALLVVYAGYVLVAYGINHITGGCVSFKNTAWPTGGTVTDPCKGGVTTTPGTPAATGNHGALSTVVGAPGASPNSAPNATTIPNTNPGPGGYSIKGQPSNPKRQNFTYTSILTQGGNG